MIGIPFFINSFAILQAKCVFPTPLFPTKINPFLSSKLNVFQLKLGESHRFL